MASATSGAGEVRARRRPGPGLGGGQGGAAPGNATPPLDPSSPLRGACSAPTLQFCFPPPSMPCVQPLATTGFTFSHSPPPSSTPPLSPLLLASLGQGTPKSGGTALDPSAHFTNPHCLCLVAFLAPYILLFWLPRELASRGGLMSALGNA